MSVNIISLERSTTFLFTLEVEGELHVTCYLTFVFRGARKPQACEATFKERFQ